MAECEEDRIAADAHVFLELFRAGDLDAATEALLEWAPDEDVSGSLAAALMGEAQDALRRGDRDEAMHRLRLVADPKFKSLGQCRAAYADALALMRPGRARCVPSHDVETHLANGWQVRGFVGDHCLMASPAPEGKTP